MKWVSAAVEALAIADPFFAAELKRRVLRALGPKPSGVKLATGCLDGCLRILDAATGVVEPTPAIHSILIVLKAGETVYQTGELVPKNSLK